MSKPFKVSQSKVKTWRKCKRSYYYKYIEKIRKLRPSRPLVFGKLIHEMIETDANRKDPMSVLKKIRKDIGQMKMYSEEKDMYGDIINDTQDIMSEYFDYWADQPLRYIRKNGKYAEHEFEIDIADGILWNGKIDAIAKTHNGLRVLVEHKSFGNKPTIDDRWRNVQSPTYTRAIDILGWRPVEAVCWDYVRSKPPTVPTLLKDGTMSVKSTITLPSVIDRFVKHHKLPHLFKYEEFRQKSVDGLSEWFDRIVSVINPSTVDVVFNDFVADAIDARDNGDKRQEMSIDRHCSWCDYEPLCRARLEGNDYDFIKEKQYGPDTRDQEAADNTPDE